MSTGLWTLTNAESDRVGLLSKLAAYLELTKPRISIMVLAVVTIAFYMCNPRSQFVWLLWPALLGTALVAASASSWNQWLEQKLDAAMPRTRNRPLPSGVLSNWEVMLFGSLTLVAGLAILFFVLNWQAAFWGVATWVFYVVLYTPMKTMSPTNTAVGAISGALPMLIGAAAADATVGITTFGFLDLHSMSGFESVGLRLLTMFLILYLWQFPHFMAIAWIYREDYALAGMRMLTVVDPSGKRAGLCAVRTSFLMIPLSMLPLVAWHPISLTVCLLLGIMYAYFSLRFLLQPNERTARHLLRGSLIYLPIMLLVLLFAPSY